jgi:hypothetical protein
MSPQQAKEMWQRVAAGERDTDVEDWLRKVASKLVAEVFDAKLDRSSERAAKALAVVGFRGKQGRPSKYDGLGSIVFDESMLNLSAREVAEIAPLIDGFPGDPSTKAIQKSIEKLRAKNRK